MCVIGLWHVVYSDNILNKDSKMTRKIYLTLLCGLIFPAVPSWALVLHNESDQPPASARPAEFVVGQWSTNASCVAIGLDGWASTNYILTTRHQGGGVGTTVKFGGTGYKITEQFLTGTADLRISRLETLDGYDAKLPDFVQWYTGTNERRKPIVLGGFGKGKGTVMKDRKKTYYTWAGSSNNTQRWGTNDVGRPKSNMTVSAWTSDVLVADFDRERSGDCMIAEYDSGGGWFINDGGIWKVAALSAYGEHRNKSYYKPSDDMYGIRLSSYAAWIEGIVSAKLPASANFDGMASTFASANSVPEPAILSLLTIGGVAMIRRRRK